MCAGDYFPIFVLCFAFLPNPAKENMGISYSNKRVVKEAVLATLPVR